MGEGGAADRDAGTRFLGAGPGQRQDRCPRAARWWWPDQGAEVFAPGRGRHADQGPSIRHWEPRDGRDPEYARDDPQSGCWWAGSPGHPLRM